MNVVIEGARRLVRGSTPNAAQLRTDIATTEQQLAGAVAAAAQEHERHDRQVLELLGRDDETGLARSREAIAAADAKVDDLRRALATLQGQLAAASTDEAKIQTERKHETAESIGAQLVQRTTEMQAQFDAGVATMLEVLDLNEKLYAALPARRDIRPMVTTGIALRTRVQIHLFGASNGTICQQGMSAHQARQRPDMVATAREIVALLLSRRSA